MSYIKQEEDRQITLLKEQASWFNHDKGRGLFRKRPYAHLLRQSKHNLWESARVEALLYFEQNGVKWHTQAHNLKSSQVACVNHLMGIRKNKKLILKMLQACTSKVDFVDLLPLPYEADETYIELMRQTLWAEQIIHQTFALVKPELQEEFDLKEKFRADAVLHLHIIPRENKYVVPKKFSQEPIEKLWRGQLIAPENYQVIDPRDLFAPIAKDLDEYWVAYLEARYW